jgi:hypothetical protein
MGGAVFFEHEARAPKRSKDARPMYFVPAAGDAIVGGRQLEGRRVSKLSDQSAQHREIDRRMIAAAARAGSDACGLPLQPEPPLDSGGSYPKPGCNDDYRLSTTFVRAHDAFSQLDGMRGRHVRCV